jgi:hypothetical protein
MTETTSVVMKTRLGNEMALYSAFSRKMTMMVTITNLQTKSYGHMDLSSITKSGMGNPSSWSLGTLRGNRRMSTQRRK